MEHMGKHLQEFQSQKDKGDLTDYPLSGKYDLIYFDASVLINNLRCGQEVFETIASVTEKDGISCDLFCQREK